MWGCWGSRTRAASTGKLASRDISGAAFALPLFVFPHLAGCTKNRDTRNGVWRYENGARRPPRYGERMVNWTRVAARGPARVTGLDTHTEHAPGSQVRDP